MRWLILWYDGSTEHAKIVVDPDGTHMPYPEGDNGTWLAEQLGMNDEQTLEVILVVGLPHESLLKCDVFAPSVYPRGEEISEADLLPI